MSRVREYIAAGDIFQANLSQRFTAFGPTRTSRPVPPPQGTQPRPVLGVPAVGLVLAVVSASPEWFYQTRGDRIVTRPIKGTRPRGATPEDDARLAAELASSPKDRAELTMIVDLERNDLGRVCRYGTVRVDRRRWRSRASRRCITWSRPSRGGCVPTSARSTSSGRSFPAARSPAPPKIRAMEIIDELEPTRRSLYTGAIGYFSRGGASAFNIAIRTMLVEGDRVSYQVGGGIVADSDPEAEYRETLHKGRGMRAVIEEDGPMIWVGGRIVPDDALTVSVLDRTFEHGLGLFETLRTWGGRAVLLDRHLARLALGRRAGDLRSTAAPSRTDGGRRELLRADWPSATTCCSGSPCREDVPRRRLDPLDASGPAAAARTGKQGRRGPRLLADRA